MRAPSTFSGFRTLAGQLVRSPTVLGRHMSGIHRSGYCAYPPCESLFAARTRDQRARAALRARATCSSFVRLLARASPPRLPSATARGSFLRFSFETIRFLAMIAWYYPPSITVKSIGVSRLCVVARSSTHMPRTISFLTKCYPLSIMEASNREEAFGMAVAQPIQVDLLEAYGRRAYKHGSPTIRQAPHYSLGLDLIQDTIDAFMLSRRVANCSATTLRIYEANLGRFARVVGSTIPLTDVSPLAIQHYLVRLRESMKSISADQHDRNLRTFFRWTVEVGLLINDPMRGIPRPRAPLPLPDLPNEDELRAVLASCTATFEGVRNRAMVLVMADAGLRAGEMARTRVQDWDSSELQITVRLGKGRKDRVAFVSPVTAEAIRRHLAMRPSIGHSNPLFADAQGRPLTLRHLVQILHRLSLRAGLPANRRLHPHMLRHFAATSWLRNGVGLDHVRRLLGHNSVAMTLRYSSLVAADLQRAHREAAAIDQVTSDWPAATRLHRRR